VLKPPCNNFAGFLAIYDSPRVISSAAVFQAEPGISRELPTPQAATEPRSGPFLTADSAVPIIEIMARPLSNLDYLLTYQPNAPASTPGSSQTAVPPSSSSASSGPANEAADRYIEEASVALGGPILAALSKAPDGKQTAFQLVDTLDIRLEDLFAVLDVLSRRFLWVNVDKSDPKGNYLVTLTQRGWDNAKKTMGLNRAK
jgi:hypothetical protein